MSVKRFKKAEADHTFVGMWHIYEMSMWDEDYFNMETQAYLEIQPDNLGNFQFGLVSGYLDGYLEQTGVKERFTFTWEGQDEFFPTRGFGKARLKIAKKAISEYKKVGKTDVGSIDIMLFYVEQGVKFTLAYGDIDEPFYISMESMYEKAIEEIIKYGLKDIFQKRCRQIVENTSGIGWGFHDALSDMYEDAFN
jgi:hypothetical protein